MITIKNSPRNLAVTVLERINRQGAYSNLELNQVLKRHQLTVADKHLLTTLVYGTLQHQLSLEYWLQQFTRRKLDPWVKQLLLITLYQYHYLERVPAFAATNEAIEIAKWRGNAGIRKFVTGVLHAALKAGWPDFADISDPIQRISLTSSLPTWLVKQLAAEYDLATVAAIGQAINEPARLSIRVNRAKASLAQAQAQLAAEGVQTQPSHVAADGLIVQSGDLLASQAFAHGIVTVQDESAMLAVESLGQVCDLSQATLVLDACSAPGGKTGQVAAALTKSASQVIALDIHDHKVKLIQKNMARLGLATRVSARQGDARQLAFLADGSLDAAVVDAPCSGLGLLRRKPEIRYQKTFRDSQRLHEIQLAILAAVAPKIKKGGIITYSTCTILKEENDQTVAAFLAAHPNFALEKTQTARALKADRAAKTLTILPSDYGSDGFFIATLKRVE